MQAVDFSFESRTVGVGPRAVALVIDMVALGLFLGVPLTLLFGQRTVTRDPEGMSISYDWQLTGSGFLLWAAFAFAYFIVFEASSGSTLGKRVLHLRVVNHDGSPIGLSAAIVRNFLRFVDGFPYVIPYLLGAGSVWADPERRRLGDRVAGTVVLYR
jgi:uncharacterized RDD family membrane protein YckC